MLIRRGSQSRIMIPGDAVQVREFIPVDEVTFLFRDDFLTDESAPITSPRTAEPGPGIGNNIDTGNNAAIVGSRYAIQGAVVTTGNPRYIAPGQARVAGLLCYGIINFNARGYIGFGGSATGFDTKNMLAKTSGSKLNAIGGPLEVDSNISNGVDYQIAIVARTAGAFYLIKGGAFADWTLVWVDESNTFATLHGSLYSRSAGSITTNWDTLRVSQLPAPWDTDNGIATTVLAGARSAGDTFTHEADCLIEFEVTTVPSSGTAELYFRRQDDNNTWRITITASGNLDLWERVGGSNTFRAGIGGGPITGGERIMIIAVDEEIKVYEDNVLRFTYSNAVNFKTETSGKLISEGTGGSISDIISWPRVISGNALTALNRVADA